MRVFEVVLFGAAGVTALWRVTGRPGRTVEIAGAVLLSVALVLHIVFEGVRFQMVPTYLIAGALVAQAILRRRPGFSAASAEHAETVAGPIINRPHRSTLAKVSAGAAVAFVVAACVALPSLFPVFSYDPPDGVFGIGTADYEVPVEDGRTLVVQTWYPSSHEPSAQRVGLTSRVDLLESAYASLTGLPRLLFDNLRLVRTHAVRASAVDPARPRYPVVLFSHGPLGANRVQSVFQMEALASRGFIVVAIDHTGYSSVTVFPDGHAVLPGPDATWPVFVDTRSTAMLNTWVRDVRSVIDRLESLDRHDPAGLLTGRLDLSRIGYVGASFGGSVVVQALLDEPRIAAGVAEDGKAYFDDRTPADLDRPLMYMQSAAPYIDSTDAQLARWGLNTAAFKRAEEDHYVRQMRLFGETRAPIYNVYIKGTNHLTFSDLYLTLNLPDRSLIPIKRAHRIINAYTLAFLDRYLNGTDATLLDGRPSPYPEVVVARRNAVTGPQRAAR